MPHDASKPLYGRNLTGMRKTSDDATEYRRAQGLISCAECRRLKVKCDKSRPCGSCVRRGCPSICPNGTLSAGQGTRYVLSTTEDLHAKISEMGSRIRQLEDALAILQANVSSESHPLLSEELLSIKYGPEIHRKGVTHDQPRITSLDALDALGTLTINDVGHVKYYGPSAGSEALFLKGAESTTVPSTGDLSQNDEFSISAELSSLASSFPFGLPNCYERGIEILYSSLPPTPRAWSLCETFLEHVSWIASPIQRDELIDENLAPIYRFAKMRKGVAAPAPTESISPHKIAVLFAVLALGALTDLTIEPLSAEASKYACLSRAALALRPVFESPDISTVQAITLLGHYQVIGGKSMTLDGAWCHTSIAFKLAQSIGLHRDSGLWNLDATTINRRRSLFWELYVLDLYHSLALGRPPSIRLTYVDCEFPEDDEQTIDEHGQVRPGYRRWKYEYAKDILCQIPERTLTVGTPNYDKILELDRKVRQLDLHSSFRGSLDPDASSTTRGYMITSLVSQWRSGTMITIHRSFFAQALLDHPANPLRSSYAPSFLAAYRSASAIIKNASIHLRHFSSLYMRLWLIWSHLFSAGVIVGSIATRTPPSSMAPKAFSELDATVKLFELGAEHSCRARNGLFVLRKLRDRAIQIHAQFGDKIPSGVRPDVVVEDKEDELAIFGGHRRVLATNPHSQSNSIAPAAATLHPNTAQADFNVPFGLDASYSGVDDLTDAHPALLEYLSHFPESGNGCFDAPSSSTKCQTDPKVQEPTAMLWQASSAMPTSTMPTPDIATSGMSTFFPNLVTGYQVQEQSWDPQLVQPKERDNGQYELMTGAWMAPGVHDVDQQWMSFLREYGFLNPQNGPM